MKRQIIRIDEDLCTGCGDCIFNCPEGALEIIDGKARLVSEVQCDGLGACIGHCPEGAITIEVREAEAYDERRVIETMIPLGEKVLRAHLEHLKEHGQHAELKEARTVLREHSIVLEEEQAASTHVHPAHAHTDRAHPTNAHASAMFAGGGCPGARALSFEPPTPAEAVAPPTTTERTSRLSHWPVQLHLISPMAPYFQGRDLVLSADCVAYARADFHERFLQGKTLSIACPKLDDGREVYLDKLVALIDHSKIATLTVLTMEVPCCSGLLHLAREAVARASRVIPIRAIVIGIRGDVLADQWAMGDTLEKMAV